ncbi:class I SAM-dependent methyltransferase [Halobacteria archaeon AArc-curdl1]|uniref:Class I SAM-dependent methyltransferase n=1 Tax=Natronosalvus hydrolyticus TaxID=2979988 RepID=A0AAP2ZBY4_9EURY|nr:class I SAM-dependent methyltransferase [Halobacteria archaeon AArc-curdl1]
MKTDTDGGQIVSNSGDDSSESATNESGGRSEPDSSYRAHQKRSQTKWDRWSDWYTMSERDLEPMREDAIAHLALESGDRVLDIGCGPGVNLAMLREAVGSTGQVVAVDYSPKMLKKARERIDDHGWENVEVVRADAMQVNFDEPFDAAIASLSMSLMPDVRRTVENVHRLLAPGAPFVVFDVRPFPKGPARILNPLVWRFLHWYANWNPDDDVLDSLRAVFTECDVLETHTAGTTYTVLCQKVKATV